MRGFDFLAIVGVVLLAQAAIANPSGQDSCQEWPCHGSDNSSPGSYALAVTLAGGGTTTTWSAAASQVVTLSGSRSFTGFVAIPLLATSAAASWDSPPAGSLAPLDSNSRVMGACTGGTTNVDSHLKSSVTFAWTPPPPGSGTVTLLATVVQDINTNYEVRLQLAEAAQASVSPTPSPPSVFPPGVSPVSSPSPSRFASPVPLPSRAATPSPTGSSAPTMLVAASVSFSAITSAPALAVSRSQMQSDLAASLASLLGVGTERITCVIASSTDAPLESNRPTGRRLWGSVGGGSAAQVSANPGLNVEASASALAAVTVQILPGFAAPSSKDVAVRLMAAVAAAPADVDTPEVLAALAAVGLGPPQSAPAPQLAYSSVPLSSVPVPAAVASLAYASTLSTGPDSAVSWAVDGPLLHLCLARAVTGASQRSWFGIAFNSISSSMVPADAVSVQPGLMLGTQVSRSLLLDYALVNCTGAPEGDGLVTIAPFETYRELNMASPADTAVLRTLPCAVQASALAGPGAPLVMVATFTRTTAFPSELLANGSLAGVELLTGGAGDIIWLTAAWGFPGALTLGFHTAEMSSAMQVNLRTGAAVLVLPTGLLVSHALLSVLGLAGLVPLGMCALRCGRSSYERAGGSPSAPHAPWRRSHTALILGGALVAGIGIAIGAAATPAYAHGASLHSRMGWAVAVVLAALAAFIALAAPPQDLPAAGASSSTRVSSPTRWLMQLLWAATYALLGVATVAGGLASTATGALDASQPLLLAAGVAAATAVAGFLIAAAMELVFVHGLRCTCCCKGADKGTPRADPTFFVLASPPAPKTAALDRCIADERVSTAHSCEAELRQKLAEALATLALREIQVAELAAALAKAQAVAASAVQPAQ